MLAVFIHHEQHAGTMAAYLGGLRSAQENLDKAALDGENIIFRYSQAKVGAGMFTAYGNDFHSIDATRFKD
jgi:hypothetical protein